MSEIDPKEAKAVARLRRNDWHAKDLEVNRMGQPVFKVGDNAFYAKCGLVKVKRIEEREMGGSVQKFYVLEMVTKPVTLRVPMDSAERNGLRTIISDREVKKVYKILKDRDVKIDQTTWNRRYREYMEKIKTGSVFEIAEVLRNLFLLRHSKDLSYGERNMLKEAKNLLVKEISLAKQEQETAIEEEIQTIFAS